jgi:NAD(P)-dependent dehydrogenase (short-subunit alcohol dehydrogenase family)
MIRQNGGLILISGSISGEAGIPTQGAYAPSKGALHQMTRQMAVEYAKHHIRVNAIACGTVDTPMVHRSAKESGDSDAYWDMLKRNHPIGRIADVEEVASFYAYMASDHANFFTGSILMMDGGYTAQ